MIVEYFWGTIATEVVFVSTHITTAKIDRESAGKIVFPIIGIRDACFSVRPCFDAVVTLIFGDCDF